MSTLVIVLCVFEICIAPSWFRDSMISQDNNFLNKKLSVSGSWSIRSVNSQSINSQSINSQSINSQSVTSKSGSTTLTTPEEEYRTGNNKYNMDTASSMDIALTPEIRPKSNPLQVQRDTITTITVSKIAADINNDQGSHNTQSSSSGSTSSANHIKSQRFMRFIPKCLCCTTDCI